MKTHTLEAMAELTDDELITRVTRLTRNEREATAILIAHIAEFDRRRLYRGEGCSSTFTFCTQVLHLSEHEAYGRITAARLTRRFPVLLERLAEGSLHLTGLCILAPVLTGENLHGLVEAARHKSKIEIREIVAAIRPLPDVPASIRKTRRVAGPAEASPPASQPAMQSPVGLCDAPMPEESHATVPPSTPIVAAQSPRRSNITPVAPATYHIHFTAGAETRDRLRELQDLLRHQVADGDPAVIIDMALTVLLTEVKKKRLAQVTRPRPATSREGRNTRTIPAEVRRRVWARDEGRCAFRGRGGRRCAERGRLEFHHIRPFAAGGRATEENIELRCSMHNAYEAELYFGPRASFVRERISDYRADLELGPDRVRRGQERSSLRSGNSTTSMRKQDLDGGAGADIHDLGGPEHPPRDRDVARPVPRFGQVIVIQERGVVEEEAKIIREDL